MSRVRILDGMNRLIAVTLIATGMFLVNVPTATAADFTVCPDGSIYTQGTCTPDTPLFMVCPAGTVQLGDLCVTPKRHKGKKPHRMGWVTR